MKFPLCTLRNIRLVDEFPPACPLAEPCMLDPIALMQARGYSEGNHALRARAEVCLGCIRRLAKNSIVRELRAEAGLNGTA